MTFMHTEGEHNNAPGQTGFSRFDGLAVVLLAALAAGLFFFRIGSASFWEDEAFTWRLARDWREMWSLLLSRESNMWLYYVMLHGWMKVFGESASAIRALSAVAATLCVPMVYVTARRLFSRRVAVVAALLLAVNPTLVQYAQEARSYAWFCLAAAADTWLFVRLHFNGRHRLWPAYALVTAAGVWLHFYGIFVPLAHVVFAAAVWRRGSPWKPFIGAWTAAFLLVVPIPFLQPMSGTQTAQFMEVSFRGVLKTLDVLAGGRYGVLALAAIAVLALAARVAAKRWPRLWTVGEGLPGAFPFLVIALAVPLAAAFALSAVVRHLGAYRYFIFLLPAWSLLAAALLDRLPFRPRLFWCGAVALLAAQAILLPASYNLQKTPWDKMVHHIATQGAATDGVLMENLFNNPAYEFAMQSEPQAPPLARRNKGLLIDAEWLLAGDGRAAAARKRFPRLWLVLTPGNKSFSWDKANRLMKSLEAAYERGERFDLPGLRVIPFTGRVESARPSPVVVPPDEGLVPATLHMDGAALRRLRDQVAARDPALAEKIKLLRRAGRRAMLNGPDPVVNKKDPGPGGDPHDFVSLAYYFWPDPARSNGLPYVSRDGQINPENNAYDAVRLRTMSETVHTLAVAYYLTGNGEWAERAAAHLRAWFLDPATRMNPHLRYAQVIKGKNTGSSFGIIDSWYLVHTLDAEALLGLSPFWKKEDHAAMQAWFRQYLDWLLTGEAGKREALSPNNHGTWFDVQTASYALFVEDREQARRILEKARDTHIQRQIQPMGSQPLELDRTAAWDYVLFNLDGLCRLARLGEQVDVDVWTYTTEDGRGLRKALDWLVPYLKDGKPWTYSRSPDRSNPLLRSVLLRASRACRQPAYKALADALPPGDDLPAWLSAECSY